MKKQRKYQVQIETHTNGKKTYYPEVWVTEFLWFSHWSRFFKRGDTQLGYKTEAEAQQCIDNYEAQFIIGKDAKPYIPIFTKRGS